MKTLILTVGLPRSGKTTWARQQGIPIVCPDSIRYAIHGERYNQLAEPFVWLTAKVMVRALFLAGHDMVILDATNTTIRRRAAWESTEWACRFQVFPATAEECQRRAAEEGDTYIPPIIQRMALEFEPLTASEVLL